MTKTRTKTPRAALCALAAMALALACAPAAFAASSGAGVDSGTQDFVDNKADSLIRVKTDAEQLAAFVPLSVTLVADVKGGPLSAAPSADAYKITNNSYFAVKVSQVIAVAGSNWEYSDTALAMGTPASAAVGAINVTLTPGTAAGPTIVKGDGTSPSASDWTIGAATDAAGTALPIKVDGSTSALKKHIGDTASRAVTLSYTISPK